MPTDKPKIIFVADNELLDRLDDFRFDNRINSRSEAIRRLIDEALRKYEKKDGQWNVYNPPPEILLGLLFSIRIYGVADNKNNQHLLADPWK